MLKLFGRYGGKIHTGFVILCYFVLLAPLAVLNGFGKEFFHNGLALWGFLQISLMDVREKRIPDKLNLYLLLVNLFFLLLALNIANILTGIFWMLAGGGFFLLLAVLTKGGMGGGDIKFAGVLGLMFYGVELIFLYVLSFWLAGLFVVAGLLCKKIQAKQKVPYGPFLSLAAYITMLWGEQIIAFYLTYLKV